MKFCALLLIISSVLTPHRSPVLLPAGGVIVAFGDSITAGVDVPPMMSWPAQLSRILRRTVVNRGIPGNTLAPSRVHCLPCGIPGIDRFGRDVLAVPHVRLVLVALGLNDLLQGNGPIALPGSYRMLIAAAHAHGVRIIAITITPNLPYRHAALEAQRRAVNRWIATAPFDGVVDVSGLDSYIFDGIHPDARGYTEMARVIAESLD